MSGFNNSMNRGHKFLRNINSRFSEMIVRAQLQGLLSDENLEHVQAYLGSIKNKFEKQPGHADDKTRYDDSIPGNAFYDGRPKRILLSKYKEYKGQDFFAIGMNYGVYIGKGIVAGLGGHEVVSRIIASRGLNGVWAEVMHLPQDLREIIAPELMQLNESISLESR